ncbi:hypothetical protein ACTWP5_29480 [Streptomyces sp. 4N509B]|uniref:hypothetical protein n=1 Tax=Streptomyces sp. 4N509B TaxID=3457413 RepID=UPI003FD00772
MTTTTNTTKPTTALRPDPTVSSSAPTALERVSAALAAHPGATTAELTRAAGTGYSTTGKALATLEKTGQARREKGGRDQNNRAIPDRWHATPHSHDAAPAIDTSTDTTAAKETPAPEQRPETDNTPAGASTHDDESTPEPEPEPATRAEQALVTDTATSETSGASTPDTDIQPPAPPSDASATPQAPASRSQADDVPTTNETAAPPAPTTTSAAARLAPGALRQLVVEHLTAHPEEAFTATAISRVIERSSGAIANALATLTRQGIACQVSDRPRRHQLTRAPASDGQ